MVCEFRQYGSLIARSCSDFENLVLPRQFHGFRHQSHDIRLRNSLPPVYGKWIVIVRLVPQGLIDKEMPGNRFHCRKYARVPDPPCPYL